MNTKSKNRSDQHLQAEIVFNATFVNDKDRDYYSAFGRGFGAIMDRFVFGASFDLNVRGKIVVHIMEYATPANKTMVTQRVLAYLNRQVIKGVLVGELVPTAILPPARPSVNELAINDINPLPELRTPLRDQLQLLWRAANKLGLIDAADWVSNNIPSGKK